MKNIQTKIKTFSSVYGMMSWKTEDWIKSPIKKI